MIQLRARRTIEPNEPLRDDAENHAGRNTPLNAQFGEPGDRRHRIVGMKGRENEMSGHRSVNGGLRGLGIANLADKNHVGILPQDGAQARAQTSGRLARESGSA